MQLFALEYSSTSKTHVDTVSTISIYEQFGRVSEYQTIAVDSGLRCLIVHAYNGLLRVIPLSQESRKSSSGRRSSKSASSGSGSASASSQLKVDFARGYNVRLSILNVTCIVMLPRSSNAASETSDGTEAGPGLAIISTDHSGRPHLSSHCLDLSEKEIGDKEDGPLSVHNLQDPGSERLIPVEGQANEQSGVVVIGEESLCWVSARSYPSADSPSKKGKGRAKAAEEKITAALPVGQIQA